MRVNNDTMSETIEKKAKESINEAFESGQSVSVEGMSRSAVSVKDAHQILVHEESRTAAKTGRRPLFRGINLGGAF